MQYLRHLILSIGIVACAAWSLIAAHAEDQAEIAAGKGYPDHELVATPAWLTQRRDTVVLVDVRTDAYYDQVTIPGAVRLPWLHFQRPDRGRGLAATFVGISAAEKILGEHGITRGAEVVLFDSVKRDGGATASYVFWVLDVLGHQRKRVLAGGIDAWKRAGGETTQTPVQPTPVEYVAPSSELRADMLIAGDVVYHRLDDPHYRIIDVRTPAEYLGQKGSTGIDDEPLKLGHIPGAVNIPYTEAWRDEKQKMIKSPADLQELYAGLDARQTQIVYCQSGRRGSYSYYILRLLGYSRVVLYEPSWQGWARPANHFPVETQPHELPQGGGVPPSMAGSSAVEQAGGQRSAASGARPAPESAGDEPAGGYVSCGGG